MRQYTIQPALRDDFDRIVEVALASLGKPYPLLHLQYEPEIPVSGP